VEEKTLRRELGYLMLLTPAALSGMLSVTLCVYCAGSFFPVFYYRKSRL